MLIMSGLILGPILFALLTMVCRYCGLIETDTELSVTFNRANGINKDPKYADIFNGLQQKSLFARMGHNSSSEQISFSAGL